MLVGSTCRGSMATLDMDCVHKYVNHIADASPPKAEYVRHFEANTPRALDGRYVLTGGSPPSHAFAEMEAAHSTMIEGSLPFLDRKVQQTVEAMVESLVFADKHITLIVTRIVTREAQVTVLLVTLLSPQLLLQCRSMAGRRSRLLLRCLNTLCVARPIAVLGPNIRWSRATTSLARNLLLACHRAWWAARRFNLG